MQIQRQVPLALTFTYDKCNTTRHIQAQEKDVTDNRALASGFHVSYGTTSGPGLMHHGYNAHGP